MIGARRLAVALSTVILSTACGPSIQVTTDYDPTARFSELRTWDWLPQSARERGGDRRIDNPVMERRIRSAVEQELAASGYDRVEGGEPDFRVGYHAAVEDKIDVTTMDEYYGYRRRWRVTTVDVREYKRGTLILDIVDPGRRQLIWRGWAVGAIENPSPERVDRSVREAVKRILADFPPRG